MSLRRNFYLGDNELDRLLARLRLGSVPLAENLQRHNMTATAHCPLCRISHNLTTTQSVAHHLLFCHTHTHARQSLFDSARLIKNLDYDAPIHAATLLIPPRLTSDAFALARAVQAYIKASNPSL